MTNRTNGSSSSWALYRQLWEEVCDRTAGPVKHLSFVSFFLIAVVGLGALGVWLELYSYIFPYPELSGPTSTDSLRTAVLTFFPAVAGTAAMQIMWAEKDKHIRSAAFFILALFLIPALCISPSRISNGSALTVGALMSVLSLWVWWVANAKQGDLLDGVDVDDPVGGKDPGASLSGTLDGFKH